jgi:uncharacterized OB-fold protein
MCCSQCKAEYAYTEEPREEPSFGKVPIAKYWRFMDGSQVGNYAGFNCESCGKSFQPMVQHCKYYKIPEETDNDT